MKCNNFLCVGYQTNFDENCQIGMEDIKDCEQRKAFNRIDRASKKEPEFQNCSKLNEQWQSEKQAQAGKKGQGS